MAIIIIKALLRVYKDKKDIEIKIKMRRKDNIKSNTVITIMVTERFTD